MCERSFHGCRDLRRRVIRRSITKRTPIAACTVLGQLVLGQRFPYVIVGGVCGVKGEVPDPVAEHPGPRKGLGKRLIRSRFGPILALDCCRRQKMPNAFFFFACVRCFRLF